MDEFREIQTVAQEVISLHAERDMILDEMYRMYRLEWDEERLVQRSGNNVKVTKAPDPRNVVMGVTRLLTSSEPVFTVTEGLNAPDVAGISSQIENLAHILIQASGRAQGVRLMNEIVRSAVVFGVFVIGITSTDDMLDAIQASGTPAAIARVKRIAQMTPYLFEVYDPRTCYPVRDGVGMRSFLRRTEVTDQEVIERFGVDAVEGGDSRALRRKRVLMDWWDLMSGQRCVWLDGQAKPILLAEHGLDFLPVIYQTTEGSTMFAEPERQLEPLLYTYYASGLWKRACLAMTAIYQAIAAMGLNPQFIQELGPTGEAVERDFTVPGGVFTVPMGSKFYPLANKGLIDPATLTGLEIAERKGEESTVYRQALGGGIASGLAFSTVALLSQQGRLPLVGIQTDVGWGVADAIMVALRWMKIGKRRKYKLSYAEYSAEIAAEDIPDVINVDCKIEVDLPQDKLQMANVGNLLTQAGLVDKAWVRENILQITDPDAVDERIMAEQTKQALFGEWLKVFVQSQTQQFAQEMMPPGQGMMPPEQGMMPPEQGAMGVQGLEGGLPPQLAAMGGQPIPGAGGVPEGMTSG